MSSSASAQLDHLVIAASTLEQGVAWCEATLGVTPGPGGEHALFGTHNRLLRLRCNEAANAYLEIIAIQPGKTPARPAPYKRWFDLDDATLQARLAKHGPQLIHWVASVPDLAEGLANWRALGIERGTALAASRPTPSGLLQWQISVRDDGQRLFGGALPTLIQWGDTHPAATMADSGVGLSQLTLTHPEAPLLHEALNAIDLSGPTITTGAPTLQAELQTPRGPVTLIAPN
jgi:hypothetical protein